MDLTLKDQFGSAMFRFRKAGMPFRAGAGIQPGEMFVMQRIAKKAAQQGQPVFVSDLHDNHFFTKPAISQLLNGMENKGYVRREIDKGDRRKIAVTLTAKGQETMDTMKERTDRMMETLIIRLGEENAKQLLGLLDRMADILEEIRQEEACNAGIKGDDTCD